MVSARLDLIVALAALSGAIALTVRHHPPPLHIESHLENEPVLAEKIKDMDVGFPTLNKGVCPHREGQEYLGRNDSLEVAEIPYCLGMLKAAEASGSCLIYNFGVGRDDAFLHHLAQNHSKCQVFAFDPSVSEDRWEGGAKKFFGPNVEFHSWGLYGGEGPRTMEWFHKDYARNRVQGELYTLREIQEKLGHTQQRISLFRSDCEGCEWDWVDKSMKDHPEVFERIDQMFTEIHFATTLRFDDKALHKTPAFHKMVTDNYQVVKMNVNKGKPMDRNQIAPEMVNFMADPLPCCREYFMINKHLSEL